MENIRKTVKACDCYDEYTIGIERFEDMSPTGKLRIFLQEDGDVIIQIDGQGFGGEFKSASIEFCMPIFGGGQSPHTHKALLELIEAIKRDNEERPQHREGE